jgi:hypothetical protein
MMSLVKFVRTASEAEVNSSLRKKKIVLTRNQNSIHPTIWRTTQKKINERTLRLKCAMKTVGKKRRIKT